ncbi:MAG: hydantoinase/oxoprolinase family protein [Arenicellales bacterium]|nr:hydantoinase/oxoprolinase family protein [Arenicellales bacterium]
MSKDSRKSTEWFDAQLRKAKDDFTELTRGGPDLRSREPAKRPIERESKPFESPAKTDTTQAREAIPVTPSRAEEARHQPSTTARGNQGTRESKRPIAAERSQVSRSPATGQSGYRLGADVGGTFTDILLIEEASGRSFTAKVPSTPQDSSIGVLNGIERVCDQAGVSLADISHVMHGTTVATNTVLTASGARVGLVTTKGYKQVLQIARSYVPGGLGGWVIFNKSEPLAPLELTIEADERIGAKGEIVQPLDEKALKQSLTALSQQGIEALTVSLMNAYANGSHEERVRQIADSIFPGIPISISSEVVPEMYEYERTETTVVNSYIRPVVSTYIENLEAELNRRMGGMQLHILRSDGGLASAQAAKEAPVNLLMSGPAGGVSGAVWMARQAGYTDLLTFDMGGTSTDVALIQNGVAQTRRETRVADVTVRSSSIDVRSVGAGGGSIAYVPELTKALRVGPQSAGAEPGPAAYGMGGTEPTVTDANVVLGYLPAGAKLGGDMDMDADRAEAAVETIGKAMGLSTHDSAEGIVKIVNENMFGALRLVSVEQGFDPRDFALVAFGGAGPLHANALGKLMNSWPVIIPPGPGVLCAYGDATTRVRDEASRTFVRRFSETSHAETLGILQELASSAAATLDAEGVARSDQSTVYQVDLRYAGQGMRLTLEVLPEEFETGGLEELGNRFDAMHEQLFTFALDTERELYTLRALVQGRESAAEAQELASGNGNPSAAKYAQSKVYYDGQHHDAIIFDRALLKAGDRVSGPAIVTEMDSTTLVLPGCTGEVDPVGNLLIRLD